MRRVDGSRLFGPAPHPRAVAEELRPEHLQGSAERRDEFFPAPRLNDSENAALQDYRGSGFDRGHLAPAADFKYSQAAQDAS